MGGVGAGVERSASTALKLHHLDAALVKNQGCCRCSDGGEVRPNDVFRRPTEVVAQTKEGREGGESGLKGGERTFPNS